MPAVGKLQYLEAAPRPTVRGRGTLVLLHAFPLDARMWEPQFGLAEHGWRVVAPDRVASDRGGVAARRDVTRPPAMDDYAADVIDLLDALHIEDAVIGGLSMGGYIAFAMLRRAPTYIRGLVLADTRPQADPPEGLEGRKRLLRILEAGGPAAVADEMIPKLLGETTRRTRPDVVERVRALVLDGSTASIADAIHALMTRPDSTPLLSSIHVPTLVIVGEEDSITPPAVAEEMHRAIGGSQLVRIPAAGHLANIERPDAFTDALAHFLNHRV